MKQPSRKTFVERGERRPVSLRGFALSARHDADILVSDVSYSGCQFRSEERFKSGETVELRIIKRGAIEAEIRWTADGRAGARFIEA
jgi:hypothetical protein